MIKLVSLLERVEITPEGNLRIPSVDDISLSQWARINRIMVQKGYDMRGAEDCKQSVTKFLTAIIFTFFLPHRRYYVLSYSIDKSMPQDSIVRRVTFSYEGA